jgi:hypothetical protein
MMGRFILRYTGSGPTSASFVEQVRSHQDVSILDESPHMLLVDGPEAVLRRLLETSSGWLLVPESSVSLPDPRPQVERPPD